MLGRIHYIADQAGAGDPAPVLALARSALAAGVPVVQVRAKGGTDRGRYELAAAVAALCREAGAACVVNDRVDMALAVGAAGVHLGADDLPVAEARRLLGPTALVGATARTADDARRLAREGASYLGTGPCYLTSTKQGLPGPIGPPGVAAVARAVAIPVIAIGGVNLGRASALMAAGAYGVAVAQAISGAPDPEEAARELVESVNELAPAGARS